MISLAIKYRPKTWEDVVEQGNTKTILQQQLESGEIKNAYLFCGGAGTGKTTCARIFANKINKNMGNPIELDAASNNSVDDVREIIQQAKTKSIDSEYKIFIIDECHALSNSAWQAMLKLIEEPPAKSIFIFATTDPQKIPKTILSRVQRYDFQRISQQGIVDRLIHILNSEDDAYDLDKSGVENDYWLDALDYIAKIADGGMRDAITMMDKCLAYSKDLTMDNVVKALGVADYDVMRRLTGDILAGHTANVVESIEDIHLSGIDLKQFVRQYLNFIVDVNKYRILGTFQYISIPDTSDNRQFMNEIEKWRVETQIDLDGKLLHLLDTLVKLNVDIKWDASPKYVIEAVLIKECL